jgi:hypothetical protein
VSESIGTESISGSGHVGRMEQRTCPMRALATGAVSL